MSGELVTTNNGSLLSVIERCASDESVDADKMMKLIDVQERIFNKNAEIAFKKAMNECQREMPIVVRDAENLQTNSRYAKYETIINTARPTYTKHGFSLSFGTEKSDILDHVRVTCEVMHQDGHSKKEFVDLPLDMTGIKGSVNKTAVHATGSTYSYGKRYLFCMIFNISIANEDDDAVRSGGLTVEDLLEYNAFLRDHFEEIYNIKYGLANEDYSLAAGTWCDFSENEKLTVWRAPTKGGIFTTEERKIMKETEFQEACKQVSP